MYIGKEKIDEEKYLDLTIKTIKELLDKYIDSSQLGDKDIVKHRRFLWENRTELDEIEINENCSQVALKEKIHAKKISRIRTLERQLISPYFARIDFKENGEETESFYIGLSTVENEKDFEFLVFDWRSPVSTMFYDYEIGPASYKAPGRTVEGDILFNRQFNIKNGNIHFMHNSNDSLCDDVLNDMLGGNATDKMKNIVATIQREQNEIIRNDDYKTLFIQGAAGSGKTSIALHRAAYILYKHRKELNAENILIFSPNDVFGDYISEVLPELGETNILQTTFEHFSNSFLPSNYIYENKCDHLDYIYSNNKGDNFSCRVRAMEYKNSKGFMELLEVFAKDIPKLLVKPIGIVIDEKEVISRKSIEKTFFKRFENVPLLDRIDLVKQSVFSQVETKYLSDKDEFDYVEDKEQFFIYCREEINKQIDGMITTLNSVDIYKKLWTLIEEYSKANLEEIQNLTLNYLSIGEVKFEDITPIIYLRASLEGFRNYKNIKHILIDEAQDYSPLFYHIIKKSFKNVSMTIMGDLNQRIDKHSNVKDKESITGLFENIKIAKLTKSYRSTANITNFSKGILDSYEPIEAVDRRGENPKIYISPDKRIEVIDNILKDMDKKGYKSIAILCKNKDYTRKLYDDINIDNINIIEDDKCKFKSGVNIIPSYLAKGLEFDGVIIADGETYLSEKDRNMFYTACTRALHELHIIGDSSLVSILPKDQSLYDFA